MNKSTRIDIGNIIAYILLALFVLIFVTYIINVPKIENEKINAIIEYPNCTLVHVDTTSITTSHLGYIDNDILDAIQNNSFTGNTILIHHPFEENEYKVVFISNIRNITTITKEELVRLVD